MTSGHIHVGGGQQYSSQKAHPYQTADKICATPSNTNCSPTWFAVSPAFSHELNSHMGLDQDSRKRAVRASPSCECREHSIQHRRARFGLPSADPHFPPSIRTVDSRLLHTHAHTHNRTHAGGVFAQRGDSANYYAVYPANTPENHPPTQACMIHSKQHGVQNSAGPWDPWQATD